jgi:L-ribulose-5-phosphate 3-epimerase
MGARPTRRQFMQVAGTAALALGLGSTPARGAAEEKTMSRNYDISLAGWSLHRSIGTGEGKIPMLDMPKLARDEWDIGAIELVNTMLAARDAAYIDRLAANAAANDSKYLLIMVDAEGAVASEDATERADAVKRHQAWIDIAADLGCHSIRMNWAGAPAEAAKDPALCKAVVERSKGPFRELCTYGDTKDINVIIENHGGPSSYPESLIQLIVAVDHGRFGTLPDFGNFPGDVDRYQAVDLMMNYAKAVSAKSSDFDDATGLETTMDYERLMTIVCDKHGYEGYVGIEYEGSRLSEFEGIRATKKLLERLRA